MRGNLEHAVCRGIDDKAAGLLLFPPVVLDDLCSGIRLVAENFPAEGFFQPGNEIGREAIGIRRHRAFRDNARDFPMPCRGILAARKLTQAGKGADRRIDRRSATDTVDIKQSDLPHVRRIVFGRSSNGLQCVAHIVAKIRRIRLPADAVAVQNDNKRTFEFTHNPDLPGILDWISNDVTAIRPSLVQFVFQHLNRSTGAQARAAGLQESLHFLTRMNAAGSLHLYAGTDMFLK